MWVPHVSKMIKRKLYTYNILYQIKNKCSFLVYLSIKHMMHYSEKTVKKCVLFSIG